MSEIEPVQEVHELPGWARQAATEAIGGWALMSPNFHRSVAGALLAAEARGTQRANYALTVSEQALKDWLHVYAPDLCDEAEAGAARARIGEKGTIGYIADALAAIRAAKEGK